MSESTDEDYCLAQVRRFDRDRYLTALFAKGPDRADLLALFAFNIEVARTRELVREPMMGLIRLQWWRDAIAEIYAGQGRRHQVAQPLAAAIRRHQLSQRHFERLLEARESDLESGPPRDLAALLGYAEGTSASLIWLTLEVLAGGRQPPASDVQSAARQAAMASALAGLLRAVPFHARGRRVMLPQTIMAEVGLNESELFELKASLALSAAVRAVAGQARQYLDSMGLDRLVLPRRLRPAFLPAVMAADDLRRLERAGFNPFDPSVQQSPPWRIWRLVPAGLFGRFRVTRD
ncbi:MAG: phytoene/squalene synthase family protein [Dongiaceae bacterium]